MLLVTKKNATMPPEQISEEDWAKVADTYKDKYTVTTLSTETPKAVKAILEEPKGK